MKQLHSAFLILIHKIILYPFLRIIVGMEVKNNTSLSHSNYIIVSNHSSHTDTSATLSILPFSKLFKVRPVAAKDYFAINKFTKLFTKLFYNVILIDRISKEGKQKSIDQMIEAIDKGYNLLLFPEGSRVSNDDVGEFKAGVAKLLKNRPNIPFIPIHIDSSAHTLPKGDGLLVPHNFKITVGQLKHIDPAQEEEQILANIRQSVIELKENTI